MSPAVSVVIPCFNLGEYLDEAVQSVLHQTYQDFEIVIVDDGSDDPVTRDVLASYERPRTRIIRTENRGLSSARNTGLEQSAGRYVSFLDADDLFEPQFLERTIGRLEEDESIAFASCWLTAFGHKEFLWEPETCDFPWLLAENTVCTAAPIRRDALVAVGGYDGDDRVAGHQDWDLAIALVDKGYPGTIVRERLFRYRIRLESMSSWCDEPAYRARVFEYFVDKYADTYRRHVPGVLDAIRRRTDEVEIHLQTDPPPRPQVSEDDWRNAILELERHRRAVEEVVLGQERPKTIDGSQPIDLYYVDRFLEANSASIRGDVLEMNDAAYAEAFGTDVRSATVLDIAEQNADATLIADLSRPEALPDARYDCVLAVQALHRIYEIEEAARNFHRALAPGGEVLATLPCVSRVDDGAGVGGDFWRFTPASARRLFESVFDGGAVTVEAFGNGAAATAFIQGLTARELDAAELDHSDSHFPVLVAVRAKKASAGELVRVRAVEGDVLRATCVGVEGWAWDHEAPEQRLRLEVWVGDRKAGHVWARDPTDGDAGVDQRDRRVGFSFEFEQNLHADPPPAIELRTASGDALTARPLSVECVCDRAAGPTGLRASHIDSPAAGAELPFPWVNVIGWALGKDAPVVAVELCHRGEVFRRVPLGVARPDLTEAFPDAPWAGTAGFAARINLIATGGRVDLDIRAVLGDDRTQSLGRIRANVAQPPPMPVVMAVPHTGSDQVALDRVLHGQAPVSRAILLNGGSPSVPRSPGHPGVTAGRGGWNEVFDDSAALVWFSLGDHMPADFLERAAEALTRRRDASFAAAVPTHEASVAGGLTSVLSGRALGVGILFRASAARVMGGLDQGAQDLTVAQWDLAIRLAEAGHESAAIEVDVPAGGPTLVERCDEHAVRWLYRKHAAALERDLDAVLLDHEAEIGRLLRENHVKERDLESELRPRLTARRRERDRLGAKLRAAAGYGGREPDRAWGDFRRLEPVSPMWGTERGLAVDRYYIERFLAEHATDIRGTVLDVESPVYAMRYGGDRVDRCDVLDIDRTNPQATLIADLRNARELESDTYDCMVLTQVLPAVDDARAVVAECRRLLKPGGSLLATVPCAGRVDSALGETNEWWRWSYAAFHALLTVAFGSENVRVRAHGSRSTVVAFLAGMSAEEVGTHVLGRTDREAPLVLSARAIAPREGDAG